MKQSIIGKLVGGTVLLLVIFAVLGTCFAAGTAINASLRKDARIFSDAEQRIGAISVSIALAATGGGSAAQFERLRQIPSSTIEIQSMLQAVGSSMERSLLYSSEIKDAARKLQTAVGQQWSADLQEVLIRIARTQESSTLPDPSGFASFFLDTEKALESFADIAGQFDQTSAGIERTLTLLFVAFSALGAVFLFVFVAWALLSLRKDIKKLIGFSISLGLGETQPLDVEGGGEIGQLSAEMRKLGSLEGLAMRLREASERVVSDFPAVAEDAARVRASFTSQTQIVKDTSRGLAGLAAKVREVARKAGGSLTETREGGKAVEESLETIRRAIEATSLLEERTSRIEEVVALIGDVSDQTELLSLNAAIEAARAGEAGRGFTVVAQQVRKLADRSARSASEVADLAQVMQDAARRIASDARGSLQTIEALRLGLQTMSESLASVTSLAESAVEGAGSMQSALDAALELVSDTARRTQAMAASDKSLMAEMEKVADIVDQLPRGKSTGTELATVESVESSSGAAQGGAFEEAAFAEPAVSVESVQRLPKNVAPVDAIEELPSVDEDTDAGMQRKKDSEVDELEPEELEPVEDD
jgi:methyl-accepting chemotaxis protein